MSTNISSHKVLPTAATIQYKKVTSDDFEFGKFEEGLVELVADESGYIGDDLLNKINFDKSDTTIINAGPGQGKTTAAYKIVDHYAKQDDYVVIVVSPFKKLVKRDYDHLEKQPYKVANYEMLETIEPSNITDSKVHIVTINTLLLNPGEDNFLMTKPKRDYIKGIREYCLEKKKKAVFIFDEIHAGLHTFQQKYIFNLLTWKKYTHKCFVLSATFTESAIVATEYIGLLTDDQFQIFDAPRQKLPAQADLHLYITSEDYSVNDLTLLRPLAGIVEKEAKAGNRVHIITAYREFALRIADKRSKSALSKAINEHLNYQIQTGTEDTQFNTGQSNIGTTFSTGVSIDLGQDSLVIIMPSGKIKGGGSYRIGGIFTNGASAVVQAVARLRGKGSIYIFLPYDEGLIKPTYTNQIEPPNDFLEARFTGKKHHYTYDQQLTLLKDFYLQQRKDIEMEIIVQDFENWRKDRQRYLNMKATLYYPEFKQFLLEDADSYLSQWYPSFGKDYSPYVLWAAFNDQFVNATLKCVHWIDKKIESLKLTKANLIHELTSHYGGVDRMIEIVAGKTIYEAFKALLNALVSKKNDEDEYVKIELTYEGKPYPDSSKIPVPVFQAIVRILYQMISESTDTITSEGYLLDRMVAAKFKEDDGQTLEDIDKEYLSLYELREQMLLFARSNDNKLNSAFINDEMLKDLLRIADKLQTGDPLIRRLIFSFVRLVKPKQAEARAFVFKGVATPEFKKEFKEKFFRELSNTFFTIKFQKKGTKKVTEVRRMPTESQFIKRFPS